MPHLLSMRWVSFRLAVLMAIALTIGLAPLSAARAEDNGPPVVNGHTPEEWAAFEEGLCEVAGGSPRTTSTIDPQGNTISTGVLCYGGGLDGMGCTNEAGVSNCGMTFTQPPQSPAGIGRTPGRVVAKAAVATPQPTAAVMATPAVQPPSGG